MFWETRSMSTKNNLLVTFCKNTERLDTTYISLRIHFLESHLIFFSKNLRDVSDQHGEHFHQVILAFKTRDQQKCNPKMFADYCRTLKRDVPQAKQGKKSNKSYF